MTPLQRFIERRRLIRLAGGTLLAGLPVAAGLAKGAGMTAFRVVQQDNVMLHFDLKGISGHAELFALQNPHRLVIDFANTTLQTELPDGVYPQGVVQSVRSGRQSDGRLRIVVSAQPKAAGTNS